MNTLVSKIAINVFQKVCISLLDVEDRWRRFWSTDGRSKCRYCTGISQIELMYSIIMNEQMISSNYDWLTMLIRQIFINVSLSGFILLQQCNNFNHWDPVIAVMCCCWLQFKKKKFVFFCMTISVNDAGHIFMALDLSTL